MSGINASFPFTIASRPMNIRLPLLFGLALPVGAAVAAEPAAPAPKLAMTITVDQLRADYLVRFRPYFGEGGFKRLLEGGTDYRNAHYRHALTITAPGHATVATGVHANVHGIKANEWINRDTWEQMSNVEDRDSALLGINPADAGPAMLAPKAGRSPRNLQATTVADQLKLRHGGKSRVFTASNKDRSAILLGGKLADSAYWDESGSMVTSRYYHDKLPAWVEAFNAERRVHGYFGKTWERLLAPDIYDRVQGPDDAPGETVGNGLTRTFPKRFDGGGPAVSPAYFAAFDNAPFSAEFLGEFVQRAVREEKLGRHEATDFLGVSFSQLDSIGHSYGPDSHEVMDSMIRLDRVLAALLDTIDREVGLANCVIVLTADHGVQPLPEHAQGLRPSFPAGRVRVAEIDAAARKALETAFGVLPENEYWFMRDGQGYHLRPTALAARKVTAEDAAAVLKPMLHQHSAIARVFTRAEILAAEPEGDSLLAMVRRSYYAPHDRDIVWVWKPYYMDRQTAGTTHGSAYAADTHVPLVWFGAGVPRGVVHVERVGVDDIAPTLAGLIGVPAPPQALGRRLF